jgi:two-component system, NtrC family, sensor kinase
VTGDEGPTVTGTRNIEPPMALRRRSSEAFRELVTRMLDAANRGAPLVAFMDEVTALLLGESGASAVVVRLEGWGPGIRARAIRNAPDSFRFESDRPAPAAMPEDADATRALLCRALMDGRSGPPFTERGAFWCEDALETAPVDLGALGTVDIARWGRLGGFRSLALVPTGAGRDVRGILQFLSPRAGAFDDEDVAFLEDLAGVFSMACEFHRAQWALRERVKELTCLYGISRLAELHDRSIGDLLSDVVRLVPPGWQYPEWCAARIVVDGTEYRSGDVVTSSQRQTAPIVVDGTPRGAVEVVYTRPQPEIDDGPFLAEERSLIDRIAAQLGMMLERREAAMAAERLGEQLRHADRLKTIGTLTAGVAHELNEPLGAVLGFAQLAEEAPGVPQETRQDLARIVGASLRAREIIKKLMFFGRETPPRHQRLALNAAVMDAAAFVEARLEVQGITLRLDLVDPSPAAVADPGQVNQVLVNLLVNAMHAMPNGGCLTVETFDDPAGADPGMNDVGSPAGGAGQGAPGAGTNRWCGFAVSDTGVGIADDVLAQIFEPFFTTKPVGQGIGLGLSVVHGIVTAHGGKIDIESKPGDGTRIAVRLPAAASPMEPYP